MCNPTQCRYLAQASHLVAALSPTGRLRRLAPQGAAALGYDAAALAGKPLTRFMPADQHAHLARTLQRCLAADPVWEELALLASDGRRVPMLCCFQPLAGPSRSAAGAPADADGLLLTALRLEALGAAAQTETAAALGQLAFLCHRPAHRLMQTLEVLAAAHPRSTAARQCREELDRLLEAMSQAVLVSASARPRGRRKTGPIVDVVGVLASALRLLDSDRTYRRLRVTLRPEAPAIWAAAHPAGLVFVALHLARNARDATARVRSPRLSVSVFPSDDQVVIEFADNGSGLSREDLNCAFSPLLGKGGHTEHSGVGLATCHQLVRHMGGKIRLLSRPPKGTTVVVTFPAATPPT